MGHAFGFGFGSAFGGFVPWYESVKSISTGPILLLPRESVVGAVGAECTMWRDESGNGNNATTSTGGTITATGVDFNGSTMFMEIAGLTSVSTDYTMCFVVEPDTVAGTQTILGCNTNESVSHAVSGSVAAHDGTASRAGMVSTARLQMLTVVVSATTHLVSFYRDGQLLATATYDDTWTWGAVPALAVDYGGTNFFDGEIRFACIFASALSAGDLSTLHSVVANRFGITFSPLSFAGTILTWKLASAGTWEDAGATNPAEVGDDVLSWTDDYGAAATVMAGKTAPSYDGTSVVFANTERLSLPHDANWGLAADKCAWAICARIVPRQTGAEFKCLIGKGRASASEDFRCFLNVSDQLMVFWGTDAQSYAGTTTESVTLGNEHTVLWSVRDSNPGAGAGRVSCRVDGGTLTNAAVTLGSPAGNARVVGIGGDSDTYDYLVDIRELLAIRRSAGEAFTTQELTLISDYIRGAL